MSINYIGNAIDFLQFVGGQIDQVEAFMSPAIQAARRVLDRGGQTDSSNQSSSPSISSPFPGLSNQSAVNCWLNSAFQLVNHAGSYQKVMEKAPDILRDKYNLFQEEIQSDVKRSEVQTQNLREWVAEESYDVKKAGTQEDPMAFFELLHDKTNFHLPILQQRDHQDPVERIEDYIPLLLTPNDSGSFQEHFDRFFSEIVEDSGIQLTKFFAKPPEGFLVQAKRFWRDEDGTQSKLEKEVDFPMHFTLSESQCLGDAPSYAPDSFIVHHGSSAQMGHYTAYIRKDGKWWHANDSVVTPASDAEVEEALKTAYIVHYQQSNRNKRSERMLSSDSSFEVRNPSKRKKSS